VEMGEDRLDSSEGGEVGRQYSSKLNARSITSVVGFILSYGVHTQYSRMHSSARTS
jgi:hypothetical protein